MRKLAVVFLTLASILAFGQETVHPAEVQAAQAEKNIQDEARQQQRAEDTQRQLLKISFNRRKSEEFLNLFNEHVSQRDKELTPKLKRALDDGDENLIEVALDKIDSNMRDLYFNAKFAVEEYGKQLWSEAGAAYRFDLITESEYTQHLAFYRKMKARTEEPLPTPLASMITEAKKKVPTYFTRREANGFAFGKKRD